MDAEVKQNRWFRWWSIWLAWIQGESREPARQSGDASCGISVVPKQAASLRKRYKGISGKRLMRPSRAIVIAKMAQMRVEPSRYFACGGGVNANTHIWSCWGDWFTGFSFDSRCKQASHVLFRAPLPPGSCAYPRPLGTA